MAERLISWDGPRSTGTDVPVDAAAAEALHIIASRIVGYHQAELSRGNRHLGPEQWFAYATVHAKDQWPDEYRRAMGVAVHIVTAMHGTGEKGLVHGAPADARLLFDAMHGFGAEQRGHG